MVGINKFSEKERRKARRSFQSNHIARDLHTPKYKQRVINSNRKRIDNEDDSYYFVDLWDDEDDEQRT